MVRKDAGFLKAQRMGDISKMIAQNIEKGIFPENLLDMIEYNIGLSRDKAQEYIDLIIRVHEDWVWQDNKIVLK